MDRVLITEAQKADVAALTGLDVEALVECSSMALTQLSKREGIAASKKLFSTAGRKLGIPAESLQRGCFALCHLLVASARCDVNASAMEDNCVLLGFSRDSSKALCTFYEEQHDQLRALIAAPPLPCEQFARLSWRLDVRVASRATRNDATPSFLLRLDTSVGDTPKEYFVEADLAELRVLYGQMEEALQATSSAHARRLMRYLK